MEKELEKILIDKKEEMETIVHLTEMLRLLKDKKGNTLDIIVATGDKISAMYEKKIKIIESRWEYENMRRQVAEDILLQLRYNQPVSKDDWELWNHVIGKEKKIYKKKPTS